MSACVTGATSFIGTALVRRLHRSGQSVVALIEPAQNGESLRAMGIEVAGVNLENPNSIEEVLNGTQVVYHTADANLAGTQSVFEACIRRGVSHVVHLSSISVYGSAQKGEVIDESTPYDIHIDERDDDTRAMVEAEQYAAAIGYKTKLAVTILRPGIVYGPGKPLPVALLGWRAARDTSVVIGSPKQHFPLTYVENLADAMVMVTGGRGLRKFIVIDDEDLTLGYYHKIREEIEGTPTLFVPGYSLLLPAIGFEIVMWLPPLGFGARSKWRRVKLHLQDRRFNSRRIRDEIGWNPRVSLSNGIWQTLQHPPAENPTKSRVAC
jgi:nucleoside-diphosphate-sugar epimerase